LAALAGSLDRVDDRGEEPVLARIAITVGFDGFSIGFVLPITELRTVHRPRLSVAGLCVGARVAVA
jgi:hypothetical protein